MSSKNDITGDSLTSRVATEQYRDNYDRIFRNAKKMQENITTPVLLPNSEYLKVKEDLRSITESAEHEYSKWRGSRDNEMFLPRMRDNYPAPTDKELTIFTGMAEHAGPKFLTIHTGKIRPENITTEGSVSFDYTGLVSDKGMCDNNKAENNEDTE
jgi:hypothetical protein